jgi:hypothetical protein
MLWKWKDRRSMKLLPYSAGHTTIDKYGTQPLLLLLLLLLRVVTEGWTAVWTSSSEQLLLLLLVFLARRPDTAGEQAGRQKRHGGGEAEFGQYFVGHYLLSECHPSSNIEFEISQHRVLIRQYRYKPRCSELDEPRLRRQGAVTV